MTTYDHIVIIPGLSNNIKFIEWATKNWASNGIIPHVFDAQWKISEPSLQLKLDNALCLVDKLINAGKRVSILGNSAGCSFAINMYSARKSKIHKVILNCGRIKTGDLPWFSFDQATAASPSFKTACINSEKIANALTSQDKSKILTLRPLFDEVVPPDTLVIDGADNRVIPTISHAFTIGYNLTLGRGRIIRHILSR